MDSFEVVKPMFVVLSDTHGSKKFEKLVNPTINGHGHARGIL